LGKGGGELARGMSGYKKVNVTAYRRSAGSEDYLDQRG